MAEIAGYLTIHIAYPGTKETDGSSSTVGHMWYDLTPVGGQPQSFGFSPVTSGAPADYGIVTFRDNAKYTSYWSSQPFPLTADQYTAIWNFASTSGYGVYDTGRYSYIITGKNCIKFSWDSAKQAGIGINITAINGAIKPTDNIPLVEAAYKQWMKTTSWSGGPSWSDLVKSQDTINQPSIHPSPTRSSANTQLVIQVTVQQGDSLDKTIANAFNSNGQDIVNATSQLNGSYICSAGSVVNVPVTTDVNGNIIYTVQKGDNWDIISARTGVSKETLWAINKDLAEQGTFPPGMSVMYNVEDVTTSGIVAKTITSPPTPMTLSAMFAQKWQYNFQINLGPTNPAFVHAEPIDGYTWELNPNGIFWNVNAAGTPTIQDINKYAEQQRVIEITTNQTIAEVLDSSNLTSADIPSSNLA